MKNRIVLVLCFLWGAVIWVASPQLTGKVEPWDASSPLYVTSLFVAGLIGALMNRPLRSAVAVWLGQSVGFMVSVFMHSDNASLWPLGLLIAVPISSLISLVGALTGGLIARVFRKFRI